MKKILALLLLAIVFVSACTPNATLDPETDPQLEAAVDDPLAEEPPEAEPLVDDSNNESAADGTGTIGFSISTLDHPFFVGMDEGARAAQAQLDVDLIIIDAQDDTEKQASDIEDLIAQGIEVLIVNPVDSAAIAPTISDVIEAGIPVIAVDSWIEGVDVDVFIGTDNFEASQMIAEHFISIVGEGTSIAILEGTPDDSSAIDRLAGFLDIAEDRLDIVASQPANFAREEGFDAAESILSAHPDIQAIVAMDDEMALGAIEAAIGAGRTPGEDIFITGFDATDDARTAVLTGTMLFTVEQQNVGMGFEGVATALGIMLGQTYPSYIPVNVALIEQ